MASGVSLFYKIVAYMQSDHTESDYKHNKSHYRRSPCITPISHNAFCKMEQICPSQCIINYVANQRL